MNKNLDEGCVKSKFDHYSQPLLLELGIVLLEIGIDLQNVTSLGDGVFGGCSSLKAIDLPDDYLTPRDLKGSATLKLLFQVSAILQ